MRRRFDRKRALGPQPDRLSDRTRARWTAEAARLLAEGHAADLGHACRRAARELGISPREPPPARADLLAALETHRRLYGAERHRAELAAARAGAREALRVLAPFRPCAIGAVVDGSADAHAEITLLAQAEEHLRVAEHLAAHGIPVTVGESTLRPRQGRVRKLVALRFCAGSLRFAVTILPAGTSVHGLIDRDGEPVGTRADLAALERMLGESGA